jgi:LmbE family N-acetylglucosaminyl deacetylase
MHVVVIAPHPDDEAIGCGGTICLHTERGDRVAVVFLTSGELGLKHLPREEAWHIREQEAESAAAILGIAAMTFLHRPDWDLGEGVEEAAIPLRGVLRQEEPEIIYLPHAREWHPDHRAALAIVQTALRDKATGAPDLLTYEVWTPLSEYDRVENIASIMRRKLRAIRCYRSQLEGFRYDRAIRGLNRYRGILAGNCDYAEVFQSADPVRPCG